MTSPRVTVVVPAYNAERYLAEAIASVLSQTLLPAEIIVVDDGSVDGTVGVAERFAPRVHCERQRHAGPGAARNRGVQLARGEYLAFLDADDVWPADKLEIQMRTLCAAPAPDAVFGRVTQFLSPDLPAAQAARFDCVIEARPARLAGTMLMSRETFARVGWFSEELQLGEFIDWYARATERGIRDVIVPEVVLRRRIHGTNTGILRREARSDYARVVKAALDRRRAANR
jgi:glycosyltransferase involved in cell wall biosynthesis